MLHGEIFAMEELSEKTTPALDATSAEYLGQWNRLVSTTNWEKGRIIAEWRQQLIEAGAAPGSYTDEAWSSCVGSVSAQHVGRLRRVYQRFGAVAGQYQGLFWSHFQAALDWADAEMYLEGAVQNTWSVADMRAQRWEAMGAGPEIEPQPGEVVSAEFDEDAAQDEVDAANTAFSGAVEEVYNPGDADAATEEESSSAPFSDDEDIAAAEPPVRPFAAIPELPADLSDAMEAFKLAIIHHKHLNWQEVSREAVLASLEALAQLALASRD